METDARQTDIYRRMKSDRKLAVACGLHDFAHQRVLLYLHRLHPEKTEREIQLLAAVRFCGESATLEAWVKKLGLDEVWRASLSRSRRQ